MSQAKSQQHLAAFISKVSQSKRIQPLCFKHNKGKAKLFYYLLILRWKFIIQFIKSYYNLCDLSMMLMPSNLLQGLEPSIYRFTPHSKVRETSSTANTHKLTQDISSSCKHQLMSWNGKCSDPLCFCKHYWQERRMRPSLLKIYTPESENMPLPEPRESLHFSSWEARTHKQAKNFLYSSEESNYTF